MLNHHIQKAIVYKLALSSPLRFSDLKPENLDNKLFSYHLNIVTSLGLVAKNDKGLYVLTSKGKTLGVHVFSEAHDIFSRARPEQLLAVRRRDTWLMYKRNTEPLKDLVGFMHCEPTAGVDLATTASDYLKKTCALDAEFKVAGSGITTSYMGDELESYISFTVMLASDCQGEIQANDPHAKYFWLADGEIKNQQLLPSMPDILSGLADGKLFFIDKTFVL